MISAEPVACIAGILAVVTSAFVFGVVQAAEYLECIDLHTLCVLFSLMVVVAGMREEGMLQRASCGLIARARDARALCAALVACCFVGSMIVTNDVALMVFVPLSYVAFALAGCTTHFLRTVVLQTLAANLGSSLSPVGNPQNIFLQSHYSFGLDGFMLTMAPIVLLGAVCIAILVVVFLPASPITRVSIDNEEPISVPRIACLLTLFFCSLLCVGGVLPFWALFALVVAVALIAFRPLFSQVDYALLLTFVFFFVIVENLQHIGPVYEAIAAFASANPLAAAIASSQVISNVPAAVLLSGFTGDGLALLAGTNIGGLGTPVASLASLISLKLYTQFATNSKLGVRTLRYMLFFLATNVALLAVLCAYETLITLI